jgi:hypothetical protein
MRKVILLYKLVIFFQEKSLGLFLMFFSFLKEIPLDALKRKDSFLKDLIEQNKQLTVCSFILIKSFTILLNKLKNLKN